MPGGRKGGGGRSCLHEEIVGEGGQLLQAHEGDVADLALPPGVAEVVVDGPAAEHHPAHLVGGYHVPVEITATFGMLRAFRYLCGGFCRGHRA